MLMNGTELLLREEIAFVLRHDLLDEQWNISRETALSIRLAGLTLLPNVY